MEALLIRTKLQPPRTTHNLVRRLNLVDQLNQRPDRKLTLVSAPAGYGKSTLVVEWLEQLGWPYAWLSLDDADNDSNTYVLLVRDRQMRQRLTRDQPASYTIQIQGTLAAHWADYVGGLNNRSQPS